MEPFSLKNIIYWYWFLISQKTIDFLIFITVIFIFPVFPYLVIAFKLRNASDDHLRAFYGDGSIIILCSAILCSFVAMLFEHKNENQKKINLLINLVLIILFISLTLLFIDCQLNFSRDWCFIQTIIIISAGIFFITILAASYLNFRLKINYADVLEFIEKK